MPSRFIAFRAQVEQAYARQLDAAVLAHAARPLRSGIAAEIRMNAVRAGKIPGQARSGARLIARGAQAAVLLALAAAASARAGWCLGLGSLGPIHVGMPVEEVLSLADFPGMERHQSTGQCWYLRYRAGGADFDLMMIEGKVARIELNGSTRLRTLSGAGIGSSESQLRQLYGAGLQVQPHKYQPAGHTLTWRSAGGEYGLRFETVSGSVTSIQSATWQQLHYVEGCG
jgi:hypothetical protein